MRTTIEKISARVFCQWKGTGGNPVTIFAAHHQQAVSVPLQKRLAQTCEWESVILSSNSNRSDRNSNPQIMSFYMPTGEAVSFCAHAAMGGALQLANTPASFLSDGGDEKKKRIEFFADHSANNQQRQSYQAEVEDDIVSLNMKAKWTEDRLSHPPTLQRLLRDSLGLPPTSLALKDERRYPTFANASIARPKTLVRLRSVEAVQAAVAPTNLDHFRVACDAVDETTGIYLYAPHEVDDHHLLECRQFPRASGYPEDPATGIAAAALAVSLEYRKPTGLPYKIQQGTAMGKGSLIMVDGIQFEGEGEEFSSDVAFRLVGHVQVDDRETIEVEDEDP